MRASRRKWIDRLSAGALVVLAGGLGLAVYIAVRPPPPPAASGQAPASVAVRAPAQAPLTEADLAVFGTTDPAAASGVPATPALALPFQLRGIIYSTAGASVLFLESAGKMGLYRVDDLIEGWQVKSVAMDTAVFARDGREVVLGLQRRAVAGGRAESGAPRTETAMVQGHRVALPNAGKGQLSDDGRSARQTNSNIPVRRGPPPEARGVSATVAIPAATVQLARDNPTALMDGVKANPIMDKGRMVGVALSSVSGSSLAARYGLAPGDRIIAVNGEALDRPGRAYDLYAKYRQSTSVRVTLEREGLRRDVLFYAQ